jgi:hypothetical protein
MATFLVSVEAVLASLSDPFAGGNAMEPTVPAANKPKALSAASGD